MALLRIYARWRRAAELSMHGARPSGAMWRWILSHVAGNRPAFVSTSSVAAATLDAALRTLSDLRPHPCKALRVPRQSQTTLNSIILREKALLGEKSFLFDNLIVQTNHVVDTGHSSLRRRTKTRPLP